MIEQRQLSLAERVIERAATYEARLAGLGKRGSEEQLHHTRQLSQEYFVLRITLVGCQFYRKEDFIADMVLGMAARPFRLGRADGS